MSNEPSWMSKWARSPRQDRRVVENGKFVELGQVQHPTPPVEESQESALEIVQVHDETTVISGTVFEEGRYAEEVEANGGPSESEKLQAELEPLDAVTEHEKGCQTVAEIVEAVLGQSSEDKAEAQKLLLAENPREDDRPS